MFIATLFTVANLWNQTRCPITNEWAKKITSIKRDYSFSQEILSFIGKWMEQGSCWARETKLKSQMFHIFSYVDSRFAL
jgi:hypothetical protein